MRTDSTDRHDNQLAWPGCPLTVMMAQNTLSVSSQMVIFLQRQQRGWGVEARQAGAALEQGAAVSAVPWRMVDHSHAGLVNLAVHLNREQHGGRPEAKRANQPERGNEGQARPATLCKPAAMGASGRATPRDGSREPGRGRDARFKNKQRGGQAAATGPGKLTPQSPRRRAER